MVFPGRISQGCYLCRRRKVKCDETKPSCRRCIAYGKPCPGYRETVVFRCENAKVQFKCNWPGPFGLSKTRATEVFNIQDASLLGRRWPSSIPTSLLPPQEQISICYFMTSFVYSCPEDIFQGHLHFLPGIYLGGRDQCQDLAIMSAAYLAAFNKWRSPPLFEKARKTYSAALVSLQEALKCPSAVTRDETFAAALVLALFVDISNERTGSRNPHMDGVFQLLMLRGPEQRSTELGKALSGYALTQLCVEYLLGKEAKFQALNKLLPWFNGDDLLNRARTLAIRRTDLCCKFTDIHKLFQETRDAQNLPAMTCKSIVAACTTIDRAFLHLDEMEKWNVDATTYWKATQDSPKPNAAARVSQACRVDQGIASSISLMRTGDILFCWELMACAEELEKLSVSCPHAFEGVPGPLSDSSWLEERIQRIITDVVSWIVRAMSECATDKQQNLSPCGMGGLGHLVLWPAYAVVHCPLSTPAQISYCKQVLGQLGSVIGISTTSLLITTRLFS